MVFPNIYDKIINMRTGDPKPPTDIEKRDRLSGLVFTDGDKKLYRQEAVSVDENTGIVNRHFVAMWGGPTSAIIDPKAYDILKTKCGNDTVRFNIYLKAILDFEIKHSGDFERHENRLPVEEEILQILREAGYFN